MKQRLRTSRHSLVIPSVIPTQLLNQTKLGDVQPPLDGCRFIESRQISTYCVIMIFKKEMSWTAPYRDAERDTSATWTHAAVGSRLAPTGPTAETGPGLADRRHQRGRSSRSLRFRRFPRPPSKKKNLIHSFTLSPSFQVEYAPTSRGRSVHWLTTRIGNVLCEFVWFVLILLVRFYEVNDSSRRLLMANLLLRLLRTRVAVS